MSYIIVLGDNPRFLGGHSDHSPFRLWVKYRFRETLKDKPDSKPICPLYLGPGQWCAEECVTAERPFIAGAVPSAVSRWAERQIKLHDALLGASESHYNADQEHVPLEYTIPPLEEGVLWFAAWDGERMASETAKMLRLLPQGALIESITPAMLPPPYVALGIMEELREIIPEKLAERVRTVGLKMMNLLKTGCATGQLEGATADRASHRLGEMLDLYSLLQKIEQRK